MSDESAVDTGKSLAVPVNSMKRQRKGKFLLSLRLDEASKLAVEACQLPEFVRIASGGAVRFVPVSFVAKDWGVTPRRVCALLASGRLSGQQLPNGYWEVYYPYTYTEGLRGPMQKRHQQPTKTAQLVDNNSERRQE